MNLQSETCMSLKEAAGLPELQSGGRGPHLATVWRWASAGVRGVVLETGRIGGKRVTSAEAVRRFLARLAGDQVMPASAARAKQIETANAELAAAGI
ncbi:MAG: DUF1580 domain-containing protein [Phycisphaerales bacterium]|nr:DUF1580 domain-containing protein [Phycisphaerales bacterium]